jgi:hypothetical protein
MKSVFIAVIFFCFCFKVQAQAGNHPTTLNTENYILKAQAETNRLKVSLNLTDVQYQKVLEINKDYFKKLADIRTSDAANPTLRREKLDELNKKREDELKRNLVDWQFTKYKNQIDSIRHQITGH